MFVWSFVRYSTGSHVTETVTRRYYTEVWRDPDANSSAHCFLCFMGLSQSNEVVKYSISVIFEKK